MNQRTNIPGANTTNYSLFANDNSSGIYSLVVTNLAGSTSVIWQVTVTNAINVTNDLLLIYNTNSTSSIALKDYYLAHRPMVGGANVLGVACDVGEFTTSTNCNTQIVAPVLNWLTNNPTKRPQYVILFYDIPIRLTDLSSTAYFNYGGVGYHLHIFRSDWQPFVNNINAGSLADCEAYVDKLAYIGTNYSPSNLVISASAGGYGNTNYVVDNVHSPGDFNAYVNATTASAATNGLLNAGVSSATISFLTGIESATNLPHLTNEMNVAGYICWGAHSSLGGTYPYDGKVVWNGNSGWWLIETVESFNGHKGVIKGSVPTIDRFWVFF